MTKLEIDAFLAVAEHGSMSKAAESLFISQSTLSGRIRTLENELGITLFTRERGKRNTELTDIGKNFIPIAEKWEVLWQETLSAALQLQGQYLSVSAIHSFNACIMPQVCGLFATRNHSIRLKVQTRHSSESNSLIESGEIEAAFVTNPHFSRRVEAVPLFLEKMQLICSMSNEYTESIHPSEMDSRKEILVGWHHEYKQWHEYWFGMDGMPRVDTDNLGVLESYLETEDCWSVVPASVAQVLEKSIPIRFVTLEEPPKERTVFILTRGMTSISKELELMLESIKQVVIKQGADWVYD